MYESNTESKEVCDVSFQPTSTNNHTPQPCEVSRSSHLDLHGVRTDEVVSKTEINIDQGPVAQTTCSNPDEGHKLLNTEHSEACSHSAIIFAGWGLLFQSPNIRPFQETRVEIDA
eukprot:2219232-Amphidinium_carterae.1